MSHQTAKEREQRRKELERQKLEAAVRHHTLAEILKRIAATLGRIDLALVASGLLNKLEPMRKEMLARRHKLIEKSNDKVAYPQVQQAMARLLRQADEAALSKLLTEVTLLEVVDQTSQGDVDLLTVTAKRLRVDVVKVRKAVEEEFAAKRAKQEGSPADFLPLKFIATEGSITRSTANSFGAGLHAKRRRREAYSTAGRALGQQRSSRKRELPNAGSAWASAGGQPFC